MNDGVRQCMFCDAAPAVWPLPEHNNGRKPFFCGTECAAEWALLIAEENDVYFCPEHYCWSDSLGTCLLCECVTFELPPAPGTHIDEGGA